VAIKLPKEWFYDVGHKPVDAAQPCLI
jgi:hypothetical protein